MFLLRSTICFAISLTNRRAVGTVSLKERTRNEGTGNVEVPEFPIISNFFPLQTNSNNAQLCCQMNTNNVTVSQNSIRITLLFLKPWNNALILSLVVSVMCYITHCVKSNISGVGTTPVWLNKTQIMPNCEFLVKHLCNVMLHCISSFGQPFRMLFKPSLFVFHLMDISQLKSTTDGHMFTSAQQILTILSSCVTSSPSLGSNSSIETVLLWMVYFCRTIPITHSTWILLLASFLVLSTYNGDSNYCLGKITSTIWSTWWEFT